MTDNVVSFKGGPIPEGADADEENERPTPEAIFDTFETNHLDNTETLLIVSVTKDGKIVFSSNAEDMTHIMWMAKAIERIILDLTMGHGDY